MVYVCSSRDLRSTTSWHRACLNDGHEDSVGAAEGKRILEEQQVLAYRRGDRPPVRLGAVRPQVRAGPGARSLLPPELLSAARSDPPAARRARDASTGSHPFRAITIATRTRRPDASKARSALPRETPPTSAISRSARSRSFVDRGCRSTIRFP